MKKDNSFARTAVIAAVIAVCAAAAVVFAIKADKNKEANTFTKYTVSQLKDESGKESEVKQFVFTDESGENVVIDGEDYMADLAQDKFIIVKDRELAYLADGRLLPLSQNVTSCTISNSGSTVAYIVANSEDKAYEGTLYVYDTETEEITPICKTAFVSTTNRVQLSPNGRTVAYVRDYNEDEKTYTCCYFKDGKETVLGENRDILAISDGADYIYYTIEDPDNYSNIFAVYTEDNGEVILDEASFNRFYLNKDYSECVFYKGNDDPALYISRKGSEGELYMKNGADFDISSLVPHVNAVIDKEKF